MSINEMLTSGASVTISVTPADLKEFALSIVDEVSKAADAAREAEASEKYLTTKDVASLYGVTINTLWRWKRDRYLVPVKVGHRTYYKRSEVYALLNGKRGETVGRKEARHEQA